MSLLTVSQLSFSHDNGRTLFDQVSLQLDTRWKLGLVGRNGRGKTTFLKLLAGEYAHSGSIHKPVPVSYFPFPISKPEQNCLKLSRRICPELEDWRLEREISQIKLAVETLDRPFNTLSGGESTKLLLALLFLRGYYSPQGSNFLLIDEPTNHLDIASRQAVGEYLRARAGFILVSHDRSLLDSCIDHVLSINRADIELQRGNFSSWQENRIRQDQHEQAEHHQLKKDIARLNESAQRSAQWSERTENGKFGNGPVDRGFIGHKAAKMMQRAKSVESRRKKAAAEKSRLLHNLETQAPLSMQPLGFHSKRLAEVQDISITYGPNTILRNMSFSVTAGERLALHGANGCGKSSLLKLLAGESVPFQGRLHIPHRLRISYVPQSPDHVAGSLKQFARHSEIDENLLYAVLHRFGFERGQFDADMAHFSAGQKKKALLAASLCQKAHLYIWDEPLNYIDVISRMQIEELLLEYRPTVVFVEHDRAFLQRVATRVLNVE